MDTNFKQKILNISSEILINTDTVRIITDITQKATFQEELSPDYYFCILNEIKDKANYILEQCKNLDVVVSKI